VHRWIDGHGAVYISGQLSFFFSQFKRRTGRSERTMYSMYVLRIYILRWVFFFLSLFYFGSNWCGFPLSHYFTCCRPGGGRRKKKGTEAEGDFIEGRFTSSSNRWWEQILLLKPN
jgi:hypothetical protein